MKKVRVLSAALALMLAMIFVLGAMPAAAEGDSGTCPTAFTPHPVGHHGEGGGGETMDHAHKHVGLSMQAMDANDDGVVCVKMVSEGGRIHVHVDNNRPHTKLPK